MIDVRVVGVFHMADEKGPDEKIICVPLRDPAYSHIHDVHDIPAAFREEIEHFFQVYKDLDLGKTETSGFGNRTQAQEILQEARARSATPAPDLGAAPSRSAGPSPRLCRRSSDFPSSRRTPGRRRRA